MANPIEIDLITHEHKRTGFNNSILRSPQQSSEAISEVLGPISVITKKLSEGLEELEAAGDESIDGVRLYLKEITRYPLMNTSEEVAKFTELAHHRRQLIALECTLDEGHLNGSQALVEQQLATHKEKFGELYHEVVQRNLPLVVAVAKWYTGRGVALLELIQEGNLGLMEAVDYFAVKRGFKFSTFATYRIKQATGRAVREKNRNIRVPSQQYDIYANLTRTRNALVRRLGREPNTDEIVQEINLPPDEVRFLTDMFREPLSLDMTWGEDEGMTLQDSVADIHQNNVEEEGITNASNEIFQAALTSKVTDRERQILDYLYGSENNDTCHSLREAAKEFGLSPERIRQIRNEVVTRLSEDESMREYFMKVYN